jgi:hypothetical protein
VAADGRLHLRQAAVQLIKPNQSSCDARAALAHAPSLIPSRVSKESLNMASKREIAAKAIARIPHLDSIFVEKILDSLADEGIVDPGNTIRATAGMSRVEKVLAAAKTDTIVSAALKFAAGQISQCGSSLDEILNDAGDDISLTKLNEVLASKSPGFRITARTALHRAGLID